ncbi:hypothetical protein L873DRAFT_1710114, partial [Choiromyces venosus 120613-1]
QAYTVNSKLRILLYWKTRSIHYGPSCFHAPTQAEVAAHFRLPATNLSRWKKEYEVAHYIAGKGTEQRTLGGGRRRKWKEMEKELYEEFRQWYAMGRPIRRSWFRHISKELVQRIYEGEEHEPFCFSNGWFRGLLSWHEVSLRTVTNKASKLPTDFGDTILNWMQFNWHNSQPQPANENGVGDEFATIGRYQLSNICNMDEIPVPYEFIEGRTYNTKGEKTIWMQSSQSCGWNKRQGTI